LLISKTPGETTATTDRSSWLISLKNAAVSLVGSYRSTLGVEVYLIKYVGGEPPVCRTCQSAVVFGRSLYKSFLSCVPGVSADTPHSTPPATMETPAPSKLGLQVDWRMA
jgi:hypothetical protein